MSVLNLCAVVQHEASLSEFQKSFVDTFINRFLNKFIDEFPDKFSLLAEALPCMIRIVPELPIPKIVALQNTSITSKIRRAEETSRNSVPYRIP
jgi:hypothetical protein